MSGFDSIFRPGLFEGQVIFVTGGGTGIGRCTAHELASLGATVVIGGRRREVLEKTATEIAEVGGQADVVEVNIREEESVDAAFETLLAKHGRIDGLFNNAGGHFLARAEEMKPKGFRSVVDLNLNGTFIMCQAAFKHYMQDHGGAIVNMLLDIRSGSVGLSHSAASRAGIENLTKTLALEWSTSGVRLNAVAPGDILSSGLLTYEREVQEANVEMAKQYPLGRMATESEVSAAVAFLLSPAASYITGESLYIAGGVQLHKPILYPVGGEPRTKAWNGFHLKPDLAGSPFEDLA